MVCPSRKLLKSPSTIEEQIKLLKDRGLIIDDEDFAKEFLTYVTYYRFSGYTLSLRTNDIFHEGSTFRLAYQIYEFDQKLRYLLLSIIETIEIAFRTHIVNHMALKYGALSYLDNSYFKHCGYHKEFLEEFQKQIDKNKDKELFIKHHIEEYDSKFPIWVAVEIFSLGILSRFFKNMKREDQKAISLKYYNSPPYYIESWLHALVNLRNTCAHYGRLYNKNFTITPKLDKEGKQLRIKHNKLFAYIFILKRLIKNKNKWRIFLTNLQAIIDEYKEDIDISLIGFPDNWHEILQ